MALGSLIRNISDGPVTLPFPYNIMIPRGQAAVSIDPPNTLIAKCGGADAVKETLDIIDYEVNATVLGCTPHGGSDGLPTTNLANGFLKRDNTNAAWEEVAYGTSAANVGTVGAAGSANTPSRSDHVHALTRATMQSAFGAIARLFYLENPAAASATAVHAAYDASLANTFPGPITNPDTPRNVTATFSAAWDGGNITVTGTDQFDAITSEVLASNPGGSTTGVKVFKTVTGIVKGAVGTLGQNASVGTGDKLGVTPAVVNAFGMLLVDDVAEAVTVDVTYSAFTPTTVPNAAHDYKLLANV